MTCVSEFFFSPMMYSDNVPELRITILMMFKPSCAPLALFDSSFKQMDRNPPQNRTKAHKTFHINVQWKEH